MKSLNFTKKTILLLSCCWMYQVQAQQEEVIIGAPNHSIADTGVIYQDTAHCKVYSYINNELGTQPLQFNYEVDDLDSILNLKTKANTCILVKSTGASYITQDDTITGYATDTCAVVPTANGKFAILQPKDRGFYIEHFGAIAGDGLDDSQAIQKAINAAVQLDITSQVNAGPGVFDLDSGVVIYRDALSNSTYDQVTLTLSGNIAVYSSDLSVGSVTRFNLRDSTFCVAIQHARNCVIENISFTGSGNFPAYDYKKIVEYGAEEWKDSAHFRLNLHSPSCAIVIDPFHQSIPASGQYPGASEYYFGTSSAGSSMLTIRGCAFDNHYIAIANNPSQSYIKNGDNIRAVNNTAVRVHTFWAAGQTQSRSNVIDDLYTRSIHTLVSTRTIGSEIGTPPVISNVNSAGFTKQVLNIKTGGFSPVRIRDSYFEAVWSLGYTHALHTAFHQCHIKFFKPNTTNAIFSPPYHLHSTKNASFRDCSIEFFDNCNTKQPLLLYASRLTIDGGHIQGGIVAPSAYSNTGGETLNYITFQNTDINCLGQVAGHRHSGTPLISARNKILLGGEELQTSLNFVFKNHLSTYNIYYIEAGYVDIDTVNKLAKIAVSDTGRYQLGDNIFTTAWVEPYAIGMGVGGQYIRTALGYVTEIKEDTVVVKGVPYGHPEGSTSIIVASYPQFLPPIWGNFENGSDTIRSVVNGINKYPLVGMKIFNDAIPYGAYITYVNSTDSIIVISTNATATANFKLFWNAPYRQNIYYPASTFPPYDACIAGTELYLKEPTSTYYKHVCDTGGIFGSSTHPPSFEAIEY